MKKNSLFQFKKLIKQKDLIQGVFNKDFGNVSFKYGEKKNILANREKIAKALDIKLKDLYEMNQVHGSEVKILNQRLIRSIKKNTLSQTDGLITNKKNTFLMIKTADCFPVIFFDPRKKIVAAVHVGWRGAIEKIFLIGLLKMASFFKSHPEDILVAIGPGIRSCCFKHKKLIQEKLPEWKNYIKKEKDGWKSIDMVSFIKDQLIKAGIKKENLEIMDICTCCSSKGFFSHFRSLKKGQPEARFATIIGMKG